MWRAEQELNPSSLEILTQSFAGAKETEQVLRETEEENRKH
jgi:hypothetical protein